MFCFMSKFSISIARAVDMHKYKLKFAKHDLLLWLASPLSLTLSSTQVKLNHFLRELNVESMYCDQLRDISELR